MLFHSLDDFKAAFPSRPFLLLIGDPVGHSLSPLIHNRALRQCGLDWTYAAVRIPEERLAELKDVFRHPLFRGANVTIPHKVRIMDLCDHIDDRAAAIGAVNTLAVEAGRLTGYNSDIAGFLDGLKTAGLRTVSKAAVLGSGGTSRMVVKALEGLGAGQIRVFSRTPEPGQAPYSELPDYLEGAGLLVNCTPLGMWPDTGRTPVDGALLARMTHGTVYDLIYRPLETRLLKEAAAAGCRTISGVEMFVGQASRSFERWTGKRFPREDSKSLIIEQLTHAT